MKTTPPVSQDSQENDIDVYVLLGSRVKIAKTVKRKAIEICFNCRSDCTSCSISSVVLRSIVVITNE